MPVAQFRLKPRIIKAIQFINGNTSEISDFLRDIGCQFSILADPDDRVNDVFLITSSEGEMRIMDKDWIVYGVKGEISTSKPDVFEATYELVNNV
jgi:hypothetical protein